MSTTSRRAFLQSGAVSLAGATSSLAGTGVEVDYLDGGDSLHSRDGNAVTLKLEESVAKLEGSEGSLVVASGMGAISQTLTALLSYGDHILYHRCLYAGTIAFIKELERFGIASTAIDLKESTDINSQCNSRTRCVIFETASNPCLELLDCKAISQSAKTAGIVSIIDNTLLSPILMKPVKLGGDLVIHSASKYFSGDQDGLAGFVSGRREILEKISRNRWLTGGVVSPRVAGALLARIAGLADTVKTRSLNAEAMVANLRNHPAVQKLLYPSREDGERLLGDGAYRGSTFSLILRGGGDSVERLMQSLQGVRKSTAQGYERTVVKGPFLASREIGIEPGLVRISVGSEPIMQTIGTIVDALDRLVS